MNGYCMPVTCPARGQKGLEVDWLVYYYNNVVKRISFSITYPMCILININRYVYFCPNGGSRHYMGVGWQHN